MISRLEALERESFLQTLADRSIDLSLALADTTGSINMRQSTPEVGVALAGDVTRMNFAIARFLWPAAG